MRTTIRDAAIAFIAGVLIAITFDIVVQFLSTSIRLTGGVRPPLWARASANTVWAVLGGLVWLAAPVLANALEMFVPAHQVSRRSVWAVIGTAFIAVPPLYVLAQLIVLAVQITLSGTWGSESFIFISGAYYGSMLLTITPWMAAGVILRAWASHLLN